MKSGNDALAVREWLAADGDARLPGDKALAQGFTCDPAGCIARLADGALAAIVRDPAAFEEDCGRAAIVLTARTAPPFCRATVIDRTVWRQTGALALRRTANGFEREAARPAAELRPWARLRERGGNSTPAPVAPAANPPDAAPIGAFGSDD
jgi:competence protein ComEC